MKKKSADKATPSPRTGPALSAKGGHDHYQIQDAVHTLKRAEQIKADPKLHAAAKSAARDEAMALKKVAGRADKK